MTRITVTFSISIPPEMAVQLEEIRKKEHRTRSELMREALRRYITAAPLQLLKNSPLKHFESD